jgi:integrase
MSQSQVLRPLFDGNVRVADLFFDPQTGVIYFLKSVQNKKIKFSTRLKIPHIQSAKRFANAEMARRINKKKVRLTPLISDELANWVKVKESEGLERLTIKNILNARKQIEGYWGDKFCHEITPDNLPGFYEWFKVEYPGQQMENAIKYLRNFCRYLAQKTVNDLPLLPAVPKISDPDYKLNRARRQKKKANIFSSADFKAVYSAAQGVEKVVCLLMYTMATRVDETLNLRFGHEVLIDQDHPTYRWSIGQNKADHWGEHELHPRLVNELKRLKRIRNRQGTIRLFPQKTDNKKALRPQMINWDAWRERAGISFHWTSHTFRHTCLSNLFNDEKNPQALILKLYRVSLAVALETYIKPTQEGRRKMREAIRVDL